MDGGNPYQHYLSGNTDGKIILSQAPNYAHGLYVLLLPLALLDYIPAKVIWALFNIFASFCIIYLVGRGARLSNTQLIYFGLIFLCSTPFRNSVGNGQQSIFALLAFSFVFIDSKTLSSLLAGFAYFKYSFAPPLALYLLLNRGLKYFLFSLVPGVIGYIIFLFLAEGSAWDILIQPLIVAAGKQGVSPGIGDIMSLARLHFGRDQIIARTVFAYILPPLCSLFFIAYASKTQTSQLYTISVVCIISLMFFNHLGYDYVFLLPIFAYAISIRNLFFAKVIILIILFNWFGLKILKFIFDFYGWNFYPNFYLIGINFILNIGILLSLFLINRQLAKTKRNKFSR